MNEMKMVKTAADLDRFFKVLQRVVAIGMGVMVIVMAVLTVVNAVRWSLRRNWHPITPPCWVTHGLPWLLVLRLLW